MSLIVPQSSVPQPPVPQSPLSQSRFRAPLGWLLVLLPLLLGPARASAQGEAGAQAETTAQGEAAAQAQSTPQAPVTPATPAQGPSLSESELITRWLASSREVAAWRAEIGAARFDVVTATVLPNPELAVDSMFTLAGDPPDGFYNFGGELSMELPIFGQIGARRTAAESLVNVAEMSVATQLWHRFSELREAMIERAFAQGELDNIEQALGELAEVRRIIEARSSAGVAPPYDALRITTLTATLEAHAQNASIARDQAEATLLTLIDDSTLTAVPIRREGLLGFAGPLDEAQLVQLALEQRPDIQLARRSVRAFEALAAQYQRDAIPSPSLVVGGWGTLRDDSFSITAGISIPLPIFDRNQGEVGRAQVEAEGQRAMVESLTTRIGAEVRGALRARERATAAVQKFRDSGAVLTDDLLVRAQRAYHAGTFSIAELLDAYDALWDAREQLLQLERVLVLAEAALVRATAVRAPSADQSPSLPTR